MPARSSRLKRRAGTAALSQVTQSQAQSLDGEPPLKKFKQLFDESDPDRMAGADMGGESIATGSSGRETQYSLTQGGGGSLGIEQGMRVSGLDVVQEEEESSWQESVGVGVGEKRKAGAMEDEDADVDIGDVTVTKKRAVEDVNAVQPSTRSGSKPPPAAVVGKPGLKTHKTGAAPGKPDTDAAFLKALASTKRGKKAEDQFDRQFNQLKISKPGLDKEEEEWAVLEDFGDDRNVRGNFMVVVEMEVFRKEGGRPGGEVSVDWGQRPNFKKFKKVGSSSVELLGC
jgi:hypothetical protein